VLDVIGLMMSAKSLMQTPFSFRWWPEKVPCNYTLGILPFSMHTPESADECKTKMKTKLQYNDYNNNNNNNKAKEPILVKHYHHFFI
jgi:hypothetical protein